MIPLARINTADAEPAAKHSGSDKSDVRVIICEAKTRIGHPCRMPPVKGRNRCRMHGGTTSDSKTGGAPKGNTNAFLHGYYSAAARAERKRLADQLRWLKKEMKEMRKLKGL